MVLLARQSPSERKSPDQEHDEDQNEYEEQYLRDGKGCSGDSSEPQNASDQTDRQKDKSPTQHRRFPQTDFKQFTPASRAYVERL